MIKKYIVGFPLPGESIFSLPSLIPLAQDNGTTVPNSAQRSPRAGPGLEKIEALPRATLVINFIFYITLQSL